MARFRAEQLGRLRRIAEERGLQLPKEEEFEHKVVLENLEPLDYLALSRRYAEVQVQALEQEIRGYEAAAQGPDEGAEAARRGDAGAASDAPGCRPPDGSRREAVGTRAGPQAAGRS